MFWDSRIDSEFRKIWRFLDRFCCKVKSCLGISPQGDPDLVLNQQGDWIETQSYKVYTALLTQNGGDNPDIAVPGSGLNVGVSYLIEQNSGYNFILLGAPNNNVGTYFVCNQDIDTDTDIPFQLSYNLGAPVVTVLENTIGNIWFKYYNLGQYFIKSDSLFTDNKMYLVVNPLSNNDAEGNAPVCSFTPNSTSELRLTTADGGNFSNGFLNNTPIEIRVYN